MIGLFAELKVWWKLRPVLKGLEEISKMKWTVNTVIQLLGTIGQAVNVVGGLIPPAWHVWVAVVLSAIQGIVGVLAHFKNPDGTTAKIAYTPGADKPARVTARH